MVQMHPLATSTTTTTTTGVTYEAEGGIRNPACQDDDSPDVQQQQQHGSARLAAAAKKADDPAYRIQGRQEIKEVMTVCRTKLPWRFSGNLCIALLVSLIMLFGELGFIPNQQIGFYCNDPKISFKFTGDSVSTVALIVITMAVPALVIWATEWLCYSPEHYKSLDSSSRSRQCWQWYGYYSLGWWYLLFIVEIVKVVVGEPRPHFFDSCRPKEMLNCTEGYRRLYTCTNKELSWFYVNDSDKSFPSGHSALSVFMAAFLVWYLQARVPNRLVLLLIKPWLQCLAILWGAGCSLSRITDNRHHWWDVLAGASLGVAFAVFVARVFCKCFEPADDVALHVHAGQPANGPVASSNGKQRHQSVKKLLSTSSSIDAHDAREMGDLPSAWTA